MTKRQLRNYDDENPLKKIKTTHEAPEPSFLSQNSNNVAPYAQSVFITNDPNTGNDDDDFPSNASNASNASNDLNTVCQKLSKLKIECDNIKYNFKLNHDLFHELEQLKFQIKNMESQIKNMEQIIIFNNNEMISLICGFFNKQDLANTPMGRTPGSYSYSYIN